MAPCCPSCCTRVTTCLLRVLCAPCLLLRYSVRSLCVLIPWRNRVFRHMVCLYAFTFLLLLPLLCHSLMQSVYFIKTAQTKKQRKDQLHAMNDHRIVDAERYLGQMNQTQLHRELFRPPTKPIDVVISVVTVSRNRHQVDSYKPKYLTQVITKLLQQMQEAKQAGMPYKMHLEICNVDFDPATYQEAKFLATYVPMIQRFNKTHLTQDHQLEKEKKDYVFCLDKAQRHNPKYILLIEDDALPIDAFFTVLQHTIDTHLEQQYLRGEIRERTEHVAFVKLYHPERLLGYISFEVERIPEWISLAVLFASFTACWYDRTLNRNISVSFYIIYLLFMIYFLLVFLSINRSNINELRRFFPPYFYSYVPAPECCTPAMLFPQAGARALSNYLQSIECKKHFGKDIAIRRFIVESHNPKWNAYMVHPNLVSHIGMHSALRHALVDPFIM